MLLFYNVNNETMDFKNYSCEKLMEFCVKYYSLLKYALQ